METATSREGGRGGVAFTGDADRLRGNDPYMDEMYIEDATGPGTADVSSVLRLLREDPGSFGRNTHVATVHMMRGAMGQLFSYGMETISQVAKAFGQMRGLRKLVLYEWPKPIEPDRCRFLEHIQQIVELEVYIDDEEFNILLDRSLLCHRSLEKIELHQSFDLRRSNTKAWHPLPTCLQTLPRLRTILVYATNMMGRGPYSTDIRGVASSCNITDLSLTGLDLTKANLEALFKNNPRIKDFQMTDCLYDVKALCRGLLLLNSVENIYVCLDRVEDSEDISIFYEGFSDFVSKHNLPMRLCLGASCTQHMDDIHCGGLSMLLHTIKVHDGVEALTLSWYDWNDNSLMDCLQQYIKSTTTLRSLELLHCKVRKRVDHFKTICYAALENEWVESLTLNRILMKFGGKRDARSRTTSEENESNFESIYFRAEDYSDEHAPAEFCRLIAPWMVTDALKHLSFEDFSFCAEEVVELVKEFLCKPHQLQTLTMHFSLSVSQWDILCTAVAGSTTLQELKVSRIDEEQAPLNEVLRGCKILQNSVSLKSLNFNMYPNREDFEMFCQMVWNPSINGESLRFSLDLEEGFYLDVDQKSSLQELMRGMLEKCIWRDRSPFQIIFPHKSKEEQDFEGEGTLDETPVFT